MPILDDRLLIMQALIDAKKQDYDEEMNKYYSKLDNLIALIKNMIH